MAFLEILDNLIKFKTTNQKEITKAFNYIKRLCKNLYIKEYEFNGFKSILVSNKETNKFDICFITHIDVVPAKEYKMKIIDDKIFGRGTIDMKGQIAVILDLLLNNKTNKNIGLLITSDEEQGGFNGVGMISKLLDIDFAIVPDGGNDFKLVTEEKCVLNLKLTINGKEAHSSQPWNGENAILLLTEKLNLIMQKYPLPQNSQDYITSINISKISGGDILNKVPNYAECFLDIRHIKNDTKENIINFIKSLGFNVEILANGVPYEIDLSNEMVKKYIKVTEKIIDKKVSFIKCESASDARFLKIPNVIMNPEGDFPHSDNEYVTIKGLENLYKIYLEMIK